MFESHKEAVKKILEDAGLGYVKLGKPTEERHILVEKGDATYQFGIDYLRDVWYSTSYLLDCKQFPSLRLRRTTLLIRALSSAVWNGFGR